MVEPKDGSPKRRKIGHPQLEPLTSHHIIEHSGGKSEQKASVRTHSCVSSAQRAASNPLDSIVGTALDIHCNNRSAPPLSISPLGRWPDTKTKTSVLPIDIPAADSVARQGSYPPTSSYCKQLIHPREVGHETALNDEKLSRHGVTSAVHDNHQILQNEVTTVGMSSATTEVRSPETSTRHQDPNNMALDDKDFEIKASDHPSDSDSDLSSAPSQLVDPTIVVDAVTSHVDRPNKTWFQLITEVFANKTEDHLTSNDIILSIMKEHEYFNQSYSRTAIRTSVPAILSQRSEFEKHLQDHGPSCLWSLKSVTGTSTRETKPLRAITLKYSRTSTQSDATTVSLTNTACLNHADTQTCKRMSVVKDNDDPALKAAKSLQSQPCQGEAMNIAPISPTRADSSTLPYTVSMSVQTVGQAEHDSLCRRYQNLIEAGIPDTVSPDRGVHSDPNRHYQDTVPVLYDLSTELRNEPPLRILGSFPVVNGLHLKINKKKQFGLIRTAPTKSDNCVDELCPDLLKALGNPMRITRSIFEGGLYYVDVDKVNTFSSVVVQVSLLTPSRHSKVHFLAVMVGTESLTLIAKKWGKTFSLLDLESLETRDRKRNETSRNGQ